MTTDCELTGAGFLGEPVNSLTALAFVLAGVVVARRARVRWVGYALIATGIGSFLAHGPMPAGSTWAHDVSLAWLLLVITGLGIRRERWSRLPGLVAIGLLFGLFPQSAIPVEVGLAVVAVVVHIARAIPPRTIVALLSLGVVAILGRLGSGEGPLCDPDSLIQMHGIWHLGSAAIVAWWVLGLNLPGSDGRATV